MYYTCVVHFTKQGCHSDNCHLSTVLLYLFHYIFIMRVIIIKIPSPSFDNSTTDTRYFS